MAINNDKLDPQSIRQQFPALARLASGGKPYIHTDAPGGTQVPQSVINAMVQHLEQGSANASLNCFFQTGMETTQLVESARKAAGLFLNCPENTIVFGANMTSLTFAFSRAIAKSWLPGSEIIVTSLDHDANIASWIRAAQDNGCIIKQVPINDSGQLSMVDFDRLLSERTALVAFSLASNAIGTITPAREMIDKAHEVGALVYIDAVHYAAHRLIDVDILDCDFLVCSPYKFFGPHVGILYGKQEHLEMLQPYKVRPATEQCPARWETGTQNFEALAGVDACIRYIASLSGSASFDREAITNAMRKIENHEATLTTQFIGGLLDIPDFRMYGEFDAELRTSTFGLTMNKLLPNEISDRLGQSGIFSWAGNFYAMELIKSFKLEDNGGLLRLGFVHYHSEEDVSRVLEALENL